MNLEQILNERYTVKAFDTNKKIDDQTVNKIEDLLRLSPSSTNIQPWSFIIAESEEAKAKVAKSTENFGFNTQKVLDASHVVVFNVKSEMTDEHLNIVLEQEDIDGRFPQQQFKQDMDMGRRFFYNMHKNDIKDDNHWMEKQVYLNAGHFVLGLKSLGIDSVIMEGFDAGVLNQEFNLDNRGDRAILVIAIGYPSTEDFNKDLPKSRLDKSVTITRA